MKTAKILIVDDEILIAEDLKDTLSLLEFKNVFLAHNKADALLNIENMMPDVVLLDIRMEKDKDGLDIGYYISSKHKIPFIYITAHSDLAMMAEIIATKPFAYLTKPFNKTELLTNLSLALSKFNTSEEQKIIIKDGTKNISIVVDDIIYVQSEANYITVYSITARYVLRQTLEAFAQQLNSNFFKPQRGYLINLKKVTKYSKTQITLSNNVNIPLSRNILTQFEQIYKIN